MGSFKSLLYLQANLYFTLFFQVTLIYANYLIALQDVLREKMIYCVVRCDKTVQAPEVQLRYIRSCKDSAHKLTDIYLVDFLPTEISFPGPVLVAVFSGSQQHPFLGNCCQPRRAPLAEDTWQTFCHHQHSLLPRTDSVLAGEFCGTIHAPELSAEQAELENPTFVQVLPLHWPAHLVSLKNS